LCQRLVDGARGARAARSSGGAESGGGVVAVPRGPIPGTRRPGLRHLPRPHPRHPPAAGTGPIPGAAVAVLVVASAARGRLGLAAAAWSPGAGECFGSAGRSGRGRRGNIWTFLPRAVMARDPAARRRPRGSPGPVGRPRPSRARIVQRTRLTRIQTFLPGGSADRPRGRVGQTFAALRRRVRDAREPS
jgi:hypothetical protein